MGIKETTVTIRTKIQTGTDEFNAPVWKWVDEQVDNVLIAPSSSNEVLSANDLYGKKAVYTLAIPKDDTHNWEDCEVVFFGRTWRTFGIPLEGIPELIPLKWNKKVMVERYG